ncbi:zinc-binding alcohol dehydrogenase family protein [Mucilaginibacter phyllosphaerae]|uniref:2-desacetyl-2-hydroxyethyl bacteriochlorophyllide A dehydrogenase n=1 Tax=Mucilaginibacter phyllosphaerae TaxID=1812349 RepID=A0A4Y8AB77_9SPHI|nr:zinc-binding alcohol dehydrogenase family protein [Mucilaginibacter phyllosphaerae]MBB3969716.1 2-desacetyl-2-hydroxyethyl bacteriochlorophyllide A dehydrogenase [Mucilaginibacter phyllosphaerae]TEW65099.1 zinc-binding alcohol dehydrogenase family protein [Mucilaginibacter phyllosphaerae]GGH17985.1 alcohol dehydrogenase [Mucilaginibacter phyllosphaerae]
MKVLTCAEPGSLVYSEQEIPVAKKDHAIIRIRRIGICGTDLHAFGGNQPFFNYPRVLGHELAGELVDTGDAPGFSVGEAVTLIPYFNCGSCLPCRSGKPNHCVNIKVCGVHIDGGMAQYLSVPSYSLVHGKKLSFDQLALVEPLAIGAHGVNRAGVQKDEWVLVIGAGPIGLGAMEFARIAGAKVIAMDLSDAKLQFCKAYLKVDETINAASADVVEQLQRITNGDMPTVVIDATGSLAAINNGFKYMSHGARYVLIGLQKGNIEFNHPEFHKREATLMSSRNAVRADFDHVINALEQGWIDPLNYITHRVKFSGVKDDFASWTKPETGVIKAMVTVD